MRNWTLFDWAVLPIVAFAGFVVYGPLAAILLPGIYVVYCATLHLLFDNREN
jgi:hypothetical protein